MPAQVAVLRASHRLLGGGLCDCRDPGRAASGTGFHSPQQWSKILDAIGRLGHGPYRTTRFRRSVASLPFRGFCGHRLNVLPDASSRAVLVVGAAVLRP